MVLLSFIKQNATFTMQFNAYNDNDHSSDYNSMTYNDDDRSNNSGLCKHSLQLVARSHQEKCTTHIQSSILCGILSLVNWSLFTERSNRQSQDQKHMIILSWALTDAKHKWTL